MALPVMEHRAPNPPEPALVLQGLTVLALGMLRCDGL